MNLDQVFLVASPPFSQLQRVIILGKYERTYKHNIIILSPYYMIFRKLLFIHLKINCVLNMFFQYLAQSAEMIFSVISRIWITHKYRIEQIEQKKQINLSNTINSETIQKLSNVATSGEKTNCQDPTIPINKQVILSCSWGFMVVVQRFS